MGTIAGIVWLLLVGLGMLIHYYMFVFMVGIASQSTSWLSYILWALFIFALFPGFSFSLFYYFGFVFIIAGKIAAGVDAVTTFLCFWC